MTRPSCAALLLSCALTALAIPASAQEVDQAGLQRAAEALAPYQSLPVFEAPGEPFDARACAEGRRMLSIPNNSANPFLKGIIDRMKEAGALVGLEVVEWENQGQPSQWVQGFEYAIREGFDIIDLISGIDPATVDPQVRAATEAGVKVMTSHFYDPSMEQHPLVSSSLTIDFNEVGQILANWSIVNTGGEARIVLIVSNEVPPTHPLVAGIKDTLAANCPTCEIVEEINVGVTEWGTKIQPAVQSAIQANPDVNVVIPIYDSMSQFVVPALRLTGTAGTIKVPTFNGTPFVLDFIREGVVSMDIGESLDWIAYATVDGHLRDLCGLETPTALNVPFYIFDSSNVETAGVPAQFDTGYGDAYIAGFHALWGLDG
ncbi:monosaccharide ABC transporter substrate-binding protein, CUT2 family [Rubellimicrobium thermophilum DSM 16684]|uniref:Monosaccharide ABC transporter substrate-binding protein, CUT2 family n=1 Tax=Rubellimicrobium thermophilum DSM 16684 TaxID=1123069 RepID=S9SAD2_9RHOB|nr:sugar ABC transporter substrate-binding protein [Rubellimicrobium thermophilum]EPX83214.1 monosaccharide ABC transporter substrate-binding protein, CUT2 family [Rubellimicrobium thermophilum DSM 16684]